MSDTNDKRDKASHATWAEEKRAAQLRQETIERVYGAENLSPARRVIDKWSANELTNSLLRQMDKMHASEVRQFLADNRDCVVAIERQVPVRRVHLENYIPYREAELKFQECMAAAE